MKNLFLLSLVLMLFSFAAPKPSFYDFKMKTLSGKDFDFKSLKGKKVLIVNVASHCGFTSQYGDLQELHEEYQDKLVVIGVPSNSFFQEKSENDSIASFCKKNYGVTFLMMEKTEVKGKNQHPLYKWLSTKSLNGWNDKGPSWNFNKYLINEKGELIKHFSSSTNPLSKEITDLL